MSFFTPSNFGRRHIARLCSITVVSVSLVLLAGWVGNIGFLRTPLPNLPTMMPNTAAAFLLCGAALFSKTLSPKNRLARYLGTACSAAVVLIGAVTLGQYVFGYDAGIDTILLPAGDSTAPSGFLGRMAPHTSVNFTIIGLSFLSLIGRRRSARVSELLALICAVISYGAVLGHLYGAQQLYGVSNINSMALSAAGLFLICSFGLLAANSASPTVKLLTSDSLGGVTARWFAVAIIVIPTLIDKLRMTGQDQGLYDLGFGSALSQLLRVILMCGVVLYVSTKIYKLDIRRRIAERLLVQKEQRYRELFDYGQSMICIHDLEGFLTTVNPAALNSIGYDREEVIGKNLCEFMPEELRPQFPAFLRRIENEGIANGTFALVAKNGKSLMWQYQSIMVSEPGQEPYVLGNAQDITKLVEATNQLKNLSLTDDLTGLNNRRGFQTLAEQQIRLERHQGTARGLTLMFADLDGLKKINDQYGHEAGSDAIRAFADVLRSTLRSADIVARWGGDEFVILTIGSLDETAEMIVDRIHKRVAHHNAESDAPYDLACSIGVTSVPVDGGQSFESLIAEADAAMYSEKRLRKLASIAPQPILRL